MSARSLAPFAIWFLLLISAYSPLAQCKRDDAQLVHQHGALRALYINTLKKSVTGILLETPSYQPGLSADTSQLPVVPFQLERRINGEDWPVQGLSMVGLKRLDNLEMLFNHLEAHKIPGDLIECGVWRGGASIFMRGLLKAHGITDRTVHLVDSFDGLPKASTDADEDSWSVSEVLKVPLEAVKGAFERYGLLDNQVQFHKGYFRDSLPAFRQAFTGRVALLRMDGDMYESTTDILYNLVDLLSPGACIVVDDWMIPVCQSAMKDFFATHSIEPTIHRIDGVAVYFCLDAPVKLDMSWYDSFNAKRVS